MGDHWIYRTKFKKESPPIVIIYRVYLYYTVCVDLRIIRHAVYAYVDLLCIRSLAHLVMMIDEDGNKTHRAH